MCPFSLPNMKTPSFDPAQASIDALAGEAPVDTRRLRPAWLRQRFTQSLPWTPEFTEDAAWRELPPDPVPAAVLIPLVNRPQGMTLLLTLRTAHLNDHAGQISFPGGRVDPEDRDPIATALRETEEEIGLSRKHIEIIGTLPDYLTGTGFRVTPVVALVEPPFELAAAVFEVAEIFEVPLAFMPCPSSIILFGAPRPPCCAIFIIFCAHKDPTEGVADDCSVSGLILCIC